MPIAIDFCKCIGSTKKRIIFGNTAIQANSDHFAKMVVKALGKLSLRKALPKRGIQKTIGTNDKPATEMVAP